MAATARALPLERRAPQSAQPARSRQRPTVQTRRHGVDAAPRAMVRATVGIEASPRPALMLVPRRRRAARLAVVLSTLVVASMLGAAAFQTQLAQRQLELDRLDNDISSAREQYEVLRRQRSELRSPARLADIAAQNGMTPADDTEFTTISADVYTIVQQATGLLPQHTPTYAESLLEGYREVKGLSEEAP